VSLRPYDFSDPSLNVQGFLAFLDARPGEKCELIDGRPVGMAGGTVRHARISQNIAVARDRSARARGCETLRDLYVSVAANDHQLFDPDVMVRCGPVDEQARHVDDPVAVFEVLSPSTMNHDRGVKVSACLTIPGLRFVALVYSTESRVEGWARDAAGAWPEEFLVRQQAGDSFAVAPIHFKLPLAAIYGGAEPEAG
jgi:Uma2 family endonuclease